MDRRMLGEGTALCSEAFAFGLPLHRVDMGGMARHLELGHGCMEHDT